MTLKLRAVAAASALLIAISGVGTAFAQKHGGILRMYTPDKVQAQRIHQGDPESRILEAGPALSRRN